MINSGIFHFTFSVFTHFLHISLSQPVTTARPTELPKTRQDTQQNRIPLLAQGKRLCFSSMQAEVLGLPPVPTKCYNMHSLQD